MSQVAKLLGGQSATLLVLAIAGFVMPRVFGAATYGLYAAALAVVTLLQTLASMGLQQVESRYLAPMWSRGERDRAVRLASSVWMARLGLALLAGLVAAAWLGLSTGLGFGPETSVILGVLCTLRASVLATRSLLLPLGQAGRMAALDLAQVVLLLPASLLGLHLAGLRGVFLGLVFSSALLFLLSTVLVLRILPLRPGAFAWAELRPYWGYSLSTFVGMVATSAQGQMPVYLLATWAARAEAGILAVALQLSQTLKNLLTSARRALLPLLAEIEEEGDATRLLAWGGRLQLAGSAVTVLLAVSWAAVGNEVVNWLLGAEFRTVYPATTLTLLALVFVSSAMSALALLHVRERAGVVAAVLWVYAGLTLVGLLLASLWPWPHAALRVAASLVVAAVAFYLLSHGCLGWVGGLWLSLRRNLLVILPVVAVLPLSKLQLSLPVGIGAWLAFVLFYGLWVWRAGLLSREEALALQRGWRRAQRRRQRPRGESGS